MTFTKKYPSLEDIEKVIVHPQGVLNNSMKTLIYINLPLKKVKKENTVLI